MPNTIYGLKIFSSEQIKRLDAYTIEKEGISSLELMERASEAFVREYIQYFGREKTVNILCGLGNNGGDGMAIGRMLLKKEYDVNIYVISLEDSTASKEFTMEFLKLEDMIDIRQITTKKDIPVFDPQAVIIDAILGSGINRNVSGLVADVIINANNSGCDIVSVDIATGLFSNKPNLEQVIVQPAFTFSFQTPKMAFYLPQNQFYTGEVRLLDIGLSQEFIDGEPSKAVLAVKNKIALLLKPRSKFSHKGNFGHVLLFAGSKGKMGAALLSSKAAMRAGCGLLTLLTDKAESHVAQTAFWEAMCLTYGQEDAHPVLPDNYNYTLAIGPGIGTGTLALRFTEFLFRQSTKPVVIDADGLNLIALHPNLLRLIPSKSILTPHPKEFERLAGPWANDYERIEKQTGFSITHDVYVVLKGAHSTISTPEGNIVINSTGNPGMATAGSGDVLTGIIASLLAQNYSPEQAAVIGTFLHGHAGDMAVQDIGMNGLLATDIIEYLPAAFKDIIVI